MPQTTASFDPYSVKETELNFAKTLNQPMSLDQALAASATYTIPGKLPDTTDLLVFRVYFYKPSATNLVESTITSALFVVKSRSAIAYGDGLSILDLSLGGTSAPTPISGKLGVWIDSGNITLKNLDATNVSKLISIVRVL